MKKREIDLCNLSIDELYNYLYNARRLEEREVAVRIARELYRRGRLPSKYRSWLPWSEPRMAEVLRPFVDVARAIKKSRRTTYTNGGGLRRRPKADPERMMVDSYSAIKRGAVNAAFAGRVKEPGSEPIFELLVNGRKRMFQLTELDEAFAEWQRIAEAA